MGWQDEYGHEREYKRDMAREPKREATPMPEAEPTLEVAMRSYLEARSLDYVTAKRAGGWYAAYHRGPRVIIPCVRSDGGIWWQGRLIDSMKLIREEFQFQPKRWDGASGYRHDAVCYIPGEYERQTVIVEGPMDALAAAGYGFPAIALLGVDPPKIVFDFVAQLVGKSYQKGRAFIIPDNDRMAKWVGIQNELGARGVSGQLRLVSGGYKDLAEMPAHERAAFLDGTE